MTRVVRTIILSLLVATGATANVAINEIFYNAPDELDRLEYIELTNTGLEPVVLDGWTISGDVKYQFPVGSRLKPGGYLVLAKDRKLLREFYDLDAAGEFKKSLGNRGGEIRLSDAAGQLVEAVTYQDHGAWPLAADGYSASIERVCASGPAGVAWNWAPSRLSADDRNRPSGTPGSENSVAAAAVPPAIPQVEWQPQILEVNQSLALTVTPQATSVLKTAEVAYRYAAPGELGAETRIPLRRHDGKLTATLPAGPDANRLLRFRVILESESGGILQHPHPHEIRPTFTAYVADNRTAELQPAKIPLVQFFFVGQEAFEAGERYRAEQSNLGSNGFRGGFPGPPGQYPPRPGGFGEGFRGPRDAPFRGGFDRGFGPRGRMSAFESPLPPQGQAALLYTDPETKTTQVFDYVNIVQRKSGWKARFHKDRFFRGMSTVNFLFEPDERTVLNESLSYQLYGLAGNKTYDHGFMRVAMNGQPVGYHLYFEQPNSNFLERHQIDSRGDLYKLIWMGNAQMSLRVPEKQRQLRPDITGRYEKKSNRHEGHQDLVAVIESLEKATSDAETWKLIEKHFEVDQVINYFAVNSLISHWDGFFNNHFVYFDREGTGKWSIYPWDQDSTWSQRGGSAEELYEMPIYFGAEGATPDGLIKPSPQQRAANRNQGGFGGRGFGGRGFGGPGFGGSGRGRGFGWWRAGGDFSRPLLANPEFYARYTARLDELTKTVFTKSTLGPQVDDLRESLRDEFRLRARLQNANQEFAVRRLDEIIDGLHEHLDYRRAYVRVELTKK